MVFLARKVQIQIFGYLSPPPTVSPLPPILLFHSTLWAPFPHFLLLPSASVFLSTLSPLPLTAPLLFPFSSPPHPSPPTSDTPPQSLCVYVSLSASPHYHLLSDPISQVNIKVASGRPSTLSPKRPGHFGEVSAAARLLVGVVALSAGHVACGGFGV